MLDLPLHRVILRSATRAAACILVFAAIRPAAAQQVADTAFRPRIDKPAYEAGKGPVVLIDEAHENFHTATGRYQPFADLLQRDGYVVKRSTVPLSARALEAGRVLVIANATKRFAMEEAAAIRDWVGAGGSLLLIADHPPFDAAAAHLGKLFGIRFSGTVAWPEGGDSGRLVFRRTDGGLVDHPVTAGIDAVATFTGTAFQLDAPGQPLLVFGPAVYSSRIAEPSRTHLKGWLQGAVLQLGRGRIAVFGEAAMFSAQLSGPDRRPMGMNAPTALQNAPFLLNVLHWLTRPFPERDGGRQQSSRTAYTSAPRSR